MTKLLAVLAVFFAAAWFAVPASATEDPGAGFIKVCKDAGTPAVSGVFSFRIDGIADTKEVWAGQCTNPIPVVPVNGSVRVTEVNYTDADGFNTNDYTVVSAIHTTSYADPPDGALVPHSVDLVHRTALVTITPGDASKVTIVHFVNDPVSGYYEICKHQVPGAGLDTQSFNYTVSGAMGYSQDVTIPVGFCSIPFYAPAGHVDIQENGDAAYVTSIEANDDNLLDSDLDAAWAQLKVWPAPLGFDSHESLVTFTNNSAQLEICKVVPDDGSLDTAAVYSFTVNGASYSVNGAGIHWLRYDADTVYGCTLAGRYRAGTDMTVKETPKVGERVRAIWLEPFVRTADATFGGTDFTGRTVSFTLMAGDTTVYYKDVPEDPQLLKICKLGAPTGGSVVFTIAGPRYDAHGALTTGTDTVTVPVGSCSDPAAFPFAGAQVITEATSAAYHLTGVTATTDTWNGTRLGSMNLAGGSATVWVGDGITEVTFTNAANATPPPTTTTTTTVAAVPPTASTVSASAPTKVVTPAKAMKVASARVVTVGHNRYVVVRVNGAAKTARIHVTLIDKNHKVVGKLTRYVATNKAVRVGNLRLAPSVFSVKVSL